MANDVTGQQGVDNISASQITSTSAHLRYTISSRRTYRVRYRRRDVESDRGTTLITHTNRPGSYTANLTGLVPSTRYVVFLERPHDDASDIWLLRSSARFTTRARVITPPAPSSVSIGSLTRNAASASWSASTGATYYQWRIGSGSWTRTTGRSTRITGLSHNTRYTFQVRAGNSAGTSGATSRSFRTPNIAPGRPSVRAATSITTSAATISWTPRSGGTPTSYEWRLGTGSWTSTTSTSVRVTGLTSGRRYSVSVRARNSAGVSGAVSVSFTTLVSRPGTPTITGTSSISTTSATVSWRAGSGATPTSYEYRRGTSGSWSSTTSTSVRLTGLTANTRYTFQVRARNASGVSSHTSTSFRTSSVVTNPPGTPHISVSNITTSSARISISRGSGGTPTSYEYRTNTGLTGTVTGSFTLSGLSTSTSYTIYVRAVNADGRSAETLRRFTTADTLQPPSAPSLSVSNITTSGARVSVTISRATSTEYRLGTGSWTSFTGSSFDLTGLTASTNYTVSVRGSNSAGTGSSTSTSFRTLAAIQRPTTPSLSVSSITTSSARVSVTVSRATSLEYRLGTSGSWTSFGGTSFTLSNLSPDTSYTVQVRARNSAGLSGTGQSIFRTMVAGRRPSAPSVSVSAITQTTATASWSGSATSWEWRLGTSGGWTAAGSSTSANLTGLTANTSYTVQVRGTNAIGTGATGSAQFTTSASVVTPTQVPAAPIVSVTSVTLTTAVVSWTVADRADTYEYLSPNGWVSTGTSRTVTLYGLTANTSYTISVRGVNSSGAGAIGSAFFTTTPSIVIIQPPSAPAVSSSNVAETTATVSWTAAARATSYQWRINNGAWTGISALTVALTSLEPATEYTVDVRGINSSGPGLYASVTFVTTSLVVSVPNTPIELSIIPDTTTANASWSAATSGPEATSFEWRLGSTASWTSVGAETTASISGLTADTGYEFQVRAVSATGASTPASILFTTLSAALPDPAAPTAPTLDSVLAGNSRLTAEWTAPTSAGDSPITRYEIRIGSRPWANAGTEDSYTASGLINGTAYTVSVRAVSAVGVGPASNTLTGTPVAPGAIPAPNRPTGVGQSNAIQWRATISGFDTSKITSWMWELWDSSDPSARQGATATATGTSLNVTSTAPTGTGPWRIRARIVTADGTGPWSEFSEYRTATTATAPGGTETPDAAIGDRLLRVAFVPPSDDGNADRIAIEYQIRTAASGQGDDDIPPGPSGQQGTTMGPYEVGSDNSGMTYTVLELDPTAGTPVRLTNGQGYQVRHRSKNAAGTGPWSDWSATVTPNKQTAAVIEQPRLEASDDGTLSLTWNPPTADGGEEVTGYRVQLIVDGVEGDPTDLNGYNTTSMRIGLSGSLFDFDPPTG